MGSRPPGSRQTRTTPASSGRRGAYGTTMRGETPRELALAGVTNMDSASRCIREVYLPRFNHEFARPAREEGSAFVPMADPDGLDTILCELHERRVGRDNCVSFEGLSLQLPGDRHRPHYMKAKVRVRRHMDGQLSVWHGPRLLQRYGPDGGPVSLSEAA